METFINLTLDNLEKEHVCCAIADKKHQQGVDSKKSWLKERIPEGHIFRKLDAKGKVFIEYAQLEKAWAPIVGDNYLYIYCLWVSGSFKEKGYGKQLLEYCTNDARQQNKSGVCVLSTKKKTPFLSDKKFFQKYGFKVIDNVGDYELLALSFDDSQTPQIAERAKAMRIESEKLTIYYTTQCPYIANCIEQVYNYCINGHIDLILNEVDTLEKAKAIPGVFNNWAVFNQGKFVTTHLLNEGMLKKMLGI